MDKSQYPYSIFAFGRNLNSRAGISDADLIIVLCIQTASLLTLCRYIDFCTIDCHFAIWCHSCRRTARLPFETFQRRGFSTFS